MATLPEYLTEQTFETILQRMLSSVPSDLDKAEGSYIYDALSPAAIELALAAIWAQEVLRRAFASTTFGSYLDLRCEEHGLTRRAAVKATGQVTFTGLANTAVPAGTRVSTAADPLTGASSVEFTTTQAAVLDANGIAVVPIEAVEAGTGGNVAAGAITLLVAPVAGITAVNNGSPTTGGLDEEDDASLLERYLQKVQGPSAGGNKADYVRWAGEVAGVGGVSVVPVRDGPGTVSVAILDLDKKPASQALVDSVQNYIAPPWVHEVEAETMTLGGFGVSADASQADDIGDSVKMVYDAAGVGLVTHADVEALLDKPGIWQARVKVKVDNNAGAADLLQVEVWNVSGAARAKTSPAGTAEAVTIFQANDLGIAFTELIQPFYWNGSDHLELRITRLQADTTAAVWVDRVVYRSTYSKDTGEGRAPVGACVTVEPATAVLINVSARLVIATGYDRPSVEAAAWANIGAYLKSLAFAEDNDVRYVRIGQAILDTPGITDYSDLLVNGGVANIAVGVQAVAVPGTAVWS